MNHLDWAEITVSFFVVMSAGTIAAVVGRYIYDKYFRNDRDRKDGAA